MAWTKLGVVLPLGGAGEFDDVHLLDPAPLLLDGRVLLYYAGDDATVYRVGLAASDDGVHFTKLGVVIPLGVAGDFDDRHTLDAAPLLLDGRVLLYYTGYDETNYRIGVAGSDDGIHFTKLGVVIPLGAGGEFDDTHTLDAAPLVVDGRVLLYYAGDDGGTRRVGLAGSDDGIHFTKLGVVVPLGVAGDFDDRHTLDPAPLVVNGRVLLYYRGDDGNTRRIGVAASEDGIHFTKLGVVIPLGAVGDFDDTHTWDPGPIALDGRVLLYYRGDDSVNYRIGLAVSDEGI